MAENQSKTSLYLVGIVVIVVAGLLFVINTGASDGGGDSSKNTNSEGKQNINTEQGTNSLNNEEVQNVVIGVKNYNYYPNTIVVKSGKPVSISLDNTVYGCLRDFTIRDLGVRKNLKTPLDTVAFTPTKKGTFAFSCSMGMGTGKLIVE